MATQNHNDTDWLLAMAKGDLSAFELLYDKYAPMLLGVIRSTVGDTKTAETILESVFTSLILGKSQYDTSNGRVFTWLLGLARQFTRELALAKKDSSAQIRSFESFVYTSASPEKTPAVMLVFFKGCTYDEAAKTLGMSTNELKNTIRTEIKLLRDLQS
ncbi:MAG: hypothetical protein JST26_19285 [Bacteroidetes bacterium]|nr:hypothetical protein [Bacteroidota bacterium]